MTNLQLPLESLLIICTMIEVFLQIIKAALPEQKQLSAQGITILSIVMSVAMCIVMNVSIFTGQEHEIIGCIIAGLICSRGSNCVHDFYTAIASIKNKK